jgi:hypothetical protein
MTKLPFATYCDRVTIDLQYRGYKEPDDLKQRCRLLYDCRVPVNQASQFILTHLSSNKPKQLALPLRFRINN